MSKRYGFSRTGFFPQNVIYTEPLDFAEAAVIIGRREAARKAAAKRDEKPLKLKTEFARARMRSDMLGRRGSISLPLVCGTGGSNRGDPRFTDAARHKRMTKESK